MTTSGSGLLVIGGTNSLKILVLVDTVASTAALGRDWAGWPKEVGRMFITGRRNDLLAGLTPFWGDVVCCPAAKGTVTKDVGGADGTDGTAVDVDVEDGARVAAIV